MKTLIEQFIDKLEHEDGQALAEYGLILAFVFAACVIALTALGLAIAGMFGSVAGSF